MTPTPEEKIRIGTFRCWLFGHKCIGDIGEYMIDNIGQKVYRKQQIQIPFCIRCGIDKPNNHE